MNAAFVVLVAASLSGEIHRGDCGHCFRPRHPTITAWREFWCNIAPPIDPRQMRPWWPLEYPGARGRGWVAQDVAVTRRTPINVGPAGVPVVLDPRGVPHAIPGPAYTQPILGRPPRASLQRVGP